MFKFLNLGVSVPLLHWVGHITVTSGRITILLLIISWNWLRLTIGKLRSRCMIPITIVVLRKTLSLLKKES
ncbi:unnamed protein product, partial [Vitis vinifera]|uniref:Uncharacterized protein n=1 Tax=Vitis vinifera TaxID=29760 RepID=D7T0Q2_VITVI